MSVNRSSRTLGTALRFVDGLARPWLAHLIGQLRPDLLKLHGVDRQAKGACTRFLSWLVTGGPAEYQALKEDEEFLAFMNTVHPDTGLTLLQLLVYAARPDVQAAYPLAGGVDAVLGWFERHGTAEHELLAAAGTPRPVPQRQQPLPFGVNLIGYAHGQLGIGEDLRMAAQALRGSGVPVGVIDFPPGSEVPQGDRSMEPYLVDDARYAFNLFCMSALEHGRCYAERGPRGLMQGRYNIGYWPWELSRWPDAWKDLPRLVDEIWVSSTHTFDALAGIAPVPLLLMPMAVDLGRVARRTRADFGLPASPLLFCFSFDLNSSIHRKNPQACIDAFLRAFPKQRRGRGAPDVGLVIKAHAPRRANAAWNRLKALAAADRRIHVVEETLPRPELLALYRCCDCFVSLHRAEGFGRNLAEALALGLHLITTGYSGNTDFCRPPAADLVRYRLVPVRKGQYPFGEGQVWADPDVDHAAELMRQFAARPRKRRQPSLDAAYSLPSVGEAYRLRLARLAGRA